MSASGPIGSLPIPQFIQRRLFSQSSDKRSVNINNINPYVKEAKYAVRGELAIKSEQYRSQISKGEGKDLPFDSVISANIGNPQQLDQQPITFFRQVASLVENPLLLEKEELLKNGFGYKGDVIERAKKLLGDVKSVGAYSQSQGAPGIRQSVADFIERRDGYAADPQNIYLCGGASAGVNALLNVICAGPQTGVLVPIPQYPLYTATLSLINAQVVPYYLKEESQWSTDVGDMRKSLKDAQKKGIDVRAVVVINPGNPTGGSLDPEYVEQVIEMAAEEKLVVMADEVYQTNVFEGEFHSFKKALRQLQESEKNQDGKFDFVELASLHSISKGMIGECGHRGGYYEMVGFDQEVIAQIYKFVSIMLCPPVIGQCLVECMVNPPKEGEPSYPQYREEYDTIFNNLKERAAALYSAFKEMEGVECQSPQGSMYLYPTIKLPQKAIDAASKEGKNPDDFYCLALLDATGICIVPGSGFGQREGTLHFRTTFLAPGTDWVSRISEFHKKFMDDNTSTTPFQRLISHHGVSEHYATTQEAQDWSGAVDTQHDTQDSQQADGPDVAKLRYIAKAKKKNKGRRIDINKVLAAAGRKHEKRKAEKKARRHRDLDGQDEGEEGEEKDKSDPFVLPYELPDGYSDEIDPETGDFIIKGPDGDVVDEVPETKPADPEKEKPIDPELIKKFNNSRGRVQRRWLAFLDRLEADSAHLKGLRDEDLPKKDLDPGNDGQGRYVIGLAEDGDLLPTPGGFQDASGKVFAKTGLVKDMTSVLYGKTVFE